MQPREPLSRVVTHYEVIPTLPSEREAEIPFCIVFDIDGTLCNTMEPEALSDPKHLYAHYVVRNEPYRIIQVGDLVHVLQHGALELFQFLVKSNYRFAFYSAGNEYRNQHFVQELLRRALSKEDYAKVIDQVAIFSKEHLKVAQAEDQPHIGEGEFNGHYKKDLSVVMRYFQEKGMPCSMDRMILADDCSQNVMRGQERNFLHLLGCEEHDVNHFFQFQEMTAQYNQIFYIAGILNKIIKKPNPVDELARLQIKGSQLRYEQLTKEPRFYEKGLDLLKPFNSKLTWATAKLYKKQLVMDEAGRRKLKEKADLTIFVRHIKLALEASSLSAEALCREINELPALKETKGMLSLRPRQLPKAAGKCLLQAVLEHPKLNRRQKYELITELLSKGYDQYQDKLFDNTPPGDVLNYVSDVLKGSQDKMHIINTFYRIEKDISDRYPLFYKYIPWLRRLAQIQLLALMNSERPLKPDDRVKDFLQLSNTPAWLGLFRRQPSAYDIYLKMQVDRREAEELLFEKLQRTQCGINEEIAFESRKKAPFSFI